MGARRLGLRLCATCVAVVLVCLALPTPSGRDGEASREATDVVLDMLRDAEAGDEDARERIVERLAEIPAPHDAALLSAFDVVKADPTRAAQRGVLVGALERLGDDRLHALLAPSATKEAELPERARLLLLLRETSLDRAWALAIEAASRAPEEQLRRPLFRRTLHATLESVMERGRGPREPLDKVLPGLPEAVQQAVLDVHEERLGTWELSRLLGGDAELNGVVLPRLLRCAVRSHEPLDPNAELHVAWALEAHDPATRRSAALVIGRFHLAALASWLPALVGSDAPGVAGAAHRALVEMTGMELLPRQDLWERWLAAETRWLDERSVDVLRAVRSTEPETVLDALSLLPRHRLHREAFLESVEQACLHAEPAVRRAACETLGRLGAPSALRSLAYRLDDRDPSVVQSASMAMSRITGLAAPAEPAGWHEMLDLSGLH